MGDGVARDGCKFFSFEFLGGFGLMEIACVFAGCESELGIGWGAWC